MVAENLTNDCSVYYLCTCCSQSHRMPAFSNLLPLPAPVLDLDWQDSSTLATCSTDHLVLVWKVDSDKPIKTFAGHTVSPHTHIRT